MLYFIKIFILSINTQSDRITAQYFVTCKTTALRKLISTVTSLISYTYTHN